MGCTCNKLRLASEALLAALLVVGCFGDDTSSAGSGAGGAVGSQGTTSGGVSGSVGASGTSGSGSAGTPGTGGASGTAGTSGTGGTTLDAGQPCVIGTEPKPTSLPFAVDQYFIASGWMQALLIHQDTSCVYPPSGGDAGSPAAEAGTDASLADTGPQPGASPPLVQAPLPGSHCWTITYTPATASDWAGVDWQFPANNWGTSDGLVIPPGATKVSFVAWGDVGGERVSFNVGYGPSSNDQFGASLSDRFLTTTPTAYAIDITGIAYTCSSVRMGFGWISAGGAAITFHVADIRWE